MTAAASHVTLPAERFYWAVLDGSTAGAGRRADRLGYLFEGSIPGEPIEDVQAVYLPLPGPGRRVLACGVPRHVLTDEVGDDAVSLCPDALPGFVEADVDPTRLNVLTGRFLPESVRKLRRRWRLMVALIFAAGVALAVLGIERRVRAAEQRADVMNARAAVLVDEVLADTGESALPPALRLTAERRRLEQTHRQDVRFDGVVDCSAILSQLLARWPEDVPARTDSLSVTPDTVILRLRVPTQDDAQRVGDAVGSLPGFRIQQPETEAGDADVQVTLRLIANEEGAP